MCSRKDCACDIIDIIYVSELNGGTVSKVMLSSRYTKPKPTSVDFAYLAEPSNRRNIRMFSSLLDAEQWILGGHLET